MFSPYNQLYLYKTGSSATKYRRSDSFKAALCAFFANLNNYTTIGNPIDSK